MFSTKKSPVRMCRHRELLQHASLFDMLERGKQHLADRFVLRVIEYTRGIERQMSEKSNASLDKEQEKVSPQIEEEILELLAGDLKETALGFVAYLRANQMTPRQWFGPNYWRIPYEKYYLCCIIVNKDKWRVFFFSGDYNGEFEEGFIKAVQDGVRPCVSCVDDCPKGKDLTVFGKEFTNTCFQFPVQYANPDGSNLKYIKELLEYWKEVAPHSDSWHCH